MIFRVQIVRFSVIPRIHRWWRRLFLPGGCKRDIMPRHGEGCRAVRCVCERQLRIVALPAGKSIARTLACVDRHNASFCIRTGARHVGVAVVDCDGVFRRLHLFHLRDVGHIVVDRFCEKICVRQRRAVAVLAQPLTSEAPAFFCGDLRRRLVQRCAKL